MLATSLRALEKFQAQEENAMRTPHRFARLGEGDCERAKRYLVDQERSWAAAGDSMMEDGPPARAGDEEAECSAEDDGEDGEDCEDGEEGAEREFSGAQEEQTELAQMQTIVSTWRQGRAARPDE